MVDVDHIAYLIVEVQVDKDKTLDTKDEKDVTSEEDSSYVKDTQLINKNLTLNDIVQLQQDLEFLNSSEANMVRQEMDRQGIENCSPVSKK